MKKKLFSLTILIIHFFHSDSQTINPKQYEKNLTKYWLYRERLKKFFMTNIGPEFGESLPASKRKDNGEMEWGDATIYVSKLKANILSI